jgi:hypothetical protein
MAQRSSRTRGLTTVEVPLDDTRQLQAAQRPTLRADDARAHQPARIASGLSVRPGRRSRRKSSDSARSNSRDQRSVSVLCRWRIRSAAAAVMGAARISSRGCEPTAGDVVPTRT